jgi:LysR family transcriptional regulator, hydrogen peroxide-inducible genes activator
MELHQIRYFLALCEELNFTRAAERCGVAQSSLTRAIKALEAELGGALFHRERANTHLSRLGEKVKPFLGQAQTHVEDAKRQAQDFSRAQATSLRLGLMRSISPAYLRDLIAGLRARHPDIALQIVDAAAESLQHQLKSGELDVAIYALPALAADEQLSYLPLCREPLVIVLPPAHRLARQDAIRAHDLAGEPYLRRTDCGYELLARAGIDGPIATQSDRDDWILAMAAAGLGYAVMPALSAEGAGIAVRPLVDPEISREIALVTMRGRAEPAGLGALVREATRMRWPGAASGPLHPLAEVNELELAAPPR